MPALRRYRLRYLQDLLVFSKAYAFSTVAIIPMVVQIFSIYSPMVFAFLWFYGAINILAFAALTALHDHLPYKLVIYLIAISANIFVFFEPLAFTPEFNSINTTGLIFGEVTLIFGLASFWIKRRANREPGALPPA